MQTGDIILVRGADRFPLELDPQPPHGEDDRFTRYSSTMTLEKGDEVRIDGGALAPGIAIKFANAIMATHPDNGALYVFGIQATAQIENPS